MSEPLYEMRDVSTDEESLYELQKIEEHVRAIDRVRKTGIGVVFITHNVRHAMAVGDRYTVLNRGTTLGTAKRGEIQADELQDMMAGGQELAELEGSLGGTV